MPNPLYNRYGKQNIPMIPGNNKGNFGALGNLSSMMRDFNQFRQSFTGDPQQTLSQMIQTGQITNEQLNAISPIAKMFRSFFK